MRHLDFECPSASFSPGDVACITPTNPPSSVDLFFQCQPHLDPALQLRSIAPASQRWAHVAFPLSLRQFVLQHLDINGLARHNFFEFVKFFTPVELEVSRLSYFLSPAGQADFRRYCHREKRSFLEVLVDLPGIAIPVEYIFELIPPIQPRQYSIASSLLKFPGRFHLAVALVRYRTPARRLKLGLASQYLSGLPLGASLGVEFRVGSIRLPADPELPLVLVGPGTGIAPFRSFLQALEASQKRTRVALFYGCRHRDRDALYLDEFQRMFDDGRLLIWDPAFSRDQPEKVYVQHQIGKHARQIVQLFQQNCQIFICGSALEMPKDVETTLSKIWTAAQQNGAISGDFEKFSLQNIHYDTWS